MASWEDFQASLRDIESTPQNSNPPAGSWEAFQSSLNSGSSYQPWQEYEDILGGQYLPTPELFPREAPSYLYQDQSTIQQPRGYIPGPGDTLQRQVDAKIAARETSQNYAMLPKRVADAINVYKDETLARDVLDLVDQLKITYPDFEDELESLWQKGIKPEEIQATIERKSKRKQQMRDLYLEYPDNEADIKKFDKLEMDPSEIRARIQARAAAGKMPDTNVTVIQEQEKTRKSLGESNIPSDAAVAEVGDLTRQIEMGKMLNQDVSELEKRRRILSLYGQEGANKFNEVSRLREQAKLAPTPAAKKKLLDQAESMWNELQGTIEYKPSIGLQVATGLGVEAPIGAAGQMAGLGLAPYTLGISYPLLSFAGGFAGSLAAQDIEGTGKVSWGRAIRDGLLNLLPAAKQGKAAATAAEAAMAAAKTLPQKAIVVGKQSAKAAYRGAGIGAGAGTIGAYIETPIEKQRLPTWEEVATQLGMGGIMGGVFSATGEALKPGLEKAGEVLNPVFEKFKIAYRKYAGRPVSDLDRDYAAGDPDARTVVDTMRQTSKQAPSDVVPEDVIQRAEQKPVETGAAPEAAPKPESVTPTPESIAMQREQAISAAAAGKTPEQRLADLGFSAEEAQTILDDAKANGITTPEAIDSLIRDITYSQEGARATAEQARTRTTDLARQARMDEQARQRAIAERAGQPVPENVPQAAPAPTEIPPKPAAPAEPTPPVGEVAGAPARVPAVEIPARIEDLDMAALRAEVEAMGYSKARARAMEVADQFGIPTTGMTWKQILQKIEENYNAAKERQVAEGRVGEYLGDGARIQKEGQDRNVQAQVPQEGPETGGGNRPVAGGVGPEGQVGRVVSGEVEGLVKSAVDQIGSDPIITAGTLQKRLRISFTRAQELMDILEQRGIVGAQQAGTDQRAVIANAPKITTIGAGPVPPPVSPITRTVPPTTPPAATPPPAAAPPVTTPPAATGGGAVPPIPPPPVTAGAVPPPSSPPSAFYKAVQDTGKKISSIFGQFGERMKAYNIAQRTIEENRLAADAASSIRKQTEANLNYVTQKLSKTNPASQVTSDLLTVVENTGKVNVPAATVTLGKNTINYAGGTFTRADIKDMGYRDLLLMAKAGGWYNSSIRGETELRRLALQHTVSDMSPQQFASKYGLTGDDKARFMQPFDDARVLANKLGVEIQHTGLAELGSYIQQNELYAQTKYMRDISKRGFTPDPAVRDEATTIVENSLNRKIDNLSKRIGKLDVAGLDVPTYMASNDPAFVSQMAQGLDYHVQEELNSIRKDYNQLRSAIQGIVASSTPAGKTYDFVADSSGVKAMADVIVDDMVKPMAERLTNPSSGVGRATDSLLKKDLPVVFQKLFGKIDDPVAIAAASRETQGQLLGRFYAQRQLMNHTELFTNDPVLAREKKWVRLASSQRVGDPITNWDRKRFGVLAGSWTPSSVRDVLTNEKYYMINSIPQTIRSIETGLNKITNIVRGGKVFLRPKSAIKDAMTTATSGSIGSGDALVDPVEWGKAVNEAYSVLVKYAKAKATNDQKGIADAQRFFRYLAETGIHKPSSSSYWDEAASVLNGGKITGSIGDAWRMTAAGRSFLTDMPFKYAGYKARKAMATKSGNFTPQEAHDYALQRLRENYDNRDAVPASFRSFAQKFWAPDYMTYKYSIMRSRLLQLKNAYYSDLKDPRIPASVKARIIAGNAASHTLLPVMSATKSGKAYLGKTIALLSTVYGGSEMLSKNAQPVEDKKNENAVRYFQPGYMQTDPQVVFMDKDQNGTPRITVFHMTGSVAANPFEEFAMGAVQTMGMKDLAPFTTKLHGMSIDIASKFFLGEPFGATYNEPGVVEKIGKGLTALEQARATTGAARQENYQIAKEYGIDTLSSIADLASEPVGALFEVPAKQLAQKKAIERLQKRITEEKGGVTVPKGFGGEPGQPVKRYVKKSDLMDMAMQGVVPYSVKIYYPEQMRRNMLSSAAGLYHNTKTISEETATARKETMTDRQKLDNKKQLLESYMSPWIEHSAELLKLIGSSNIRADQADILAKAGLSDWEIAYLLKMELPSGGGFNFPSGL